MDGNEIQIIVTDDKEADNSVVNADNLLSSEYQYLAQTAFQANEDRARVSTYYVVTFGTLVAALFSLQVDNALLGNLHRALVIVFLTLSLFGLSTLLQLVRLRQAWTESVLALNQIKQYYVGHLGHAKLGEAFRWGPDTIPAGYKPWSMAFLLALQVALLSGVSLGASVYFLTLVLANPLWVLSILIGLIYTIFQVWLYRTLLQK